MHDRKLSDVLRAMSKSVLVIGKSVPFELSPDGDALLRLPNADANCAREPFVCPPSGPDAVFIGRVAEVDSNAGVVRISRDETEGNKK